VAKVKKKILTFPKKSNYSAAKSREKTRRKKAKISFAIFREPFWEHSGEHVLVSIHAESHKQAMPKL
jgi:hypothetical protein